MINKLVTKIFIVCFILISFANLVNAVVDEYKPYLHKASVPQHPKLKLYSEYKTNLFPGAATYTYDIEVPKGTNDLTPYLDIYYNSQTAKQRPSILGAGWYLTQNLIYRDVNGTLNNTLDDEYKLVLNNAQYDLVYSNNSYHTKIESYIKIDNLSTTSNTYGTYWQITLKDGTKYRFGYGQNSELTSNLGYNYAIKWNLDLIEDTHNNKIYYSYLENPFADDFGAVYLDEISYNNYQERKLKLNYEASERPDKRTAYEDGNKIYESRRLKDINIFANNNLVRRYSLEYANLNDEKSLSSISGINYYGSDNISILHNIAFQYHPDREDYFSLAGLYIPSELFTDYSHVDFGIRLLDFNNDGFVDIVKGRASTFEKKVFINNRNNNWTLSNYTLPVYIVDSSNNDNGVRFADVNNDGLVDLLQGIDSTQGVYLHNGTGWNLSSWTLPVSFVVSSTDNGVQLADLNGDGKIDLIQGKDSAKNAWLNNGSGWSSSSLYQTPEPFIVSSADSGARIEDLNGDGLPDIIRGSDIGGTFKTAYLNNGSGWVSYGNYSPLIYFTTSAKTDNGVRFADVNGDGLIDMLEDYKNSTLEISRAYLNNRSGWVLNNNWKSDTQFAKDGYNIGRRLGDVNGDGYADIVVAYGNATGNELYTYIKNTSTSYLLKRIVNEFGGIVEIDYSASTSYNNSDALGFNLWVVGKVNQNNSLTGDFSSVGNYSYFYFGGKYNYTALEFRGFNIVNETKPDNSVVSHYFHQSDALKGKEYMTEVYNSLGSLFSRTNNDYSYINNGYYTVLLDSSSQELYDGSSDAEITNASYQYDSYGNVIYKNNYGDTSKTGDEKFERYSYSYNTTANIVNKVIKYGLYEDDNSTLAKVTLYYYDSLDWGSSPTKGDLTKVSEWNNKGEDSITSFSYDSYGNVIKKTDALGHETKYTYGLRDTSFTYTDRVTNALGHRTDYEYDLGTGNLLWEEKENIRKTNSYDVFGRLSKEILPYDSEQLPTRQYTYTFDGSAPEIIKISQREHGGETINTYYYYDGFANLIQLKSLLENNQSVTKNIFYDGQGRVSFEQNPYFETFNSSISTPSNTTNKTYYTYDALDRVIKVTNPDNTNKTIIFDKKIITDYDENNHRHEYLLDSFGRIINVIEYNVNPNANNLEEVYNTSYVYDTTDNLIKITDNEGNEFKFTYDSLGRKIKLEDPDLGTWTYSYDATGNLIQQNDSRGNTTLMSHDALNRILDKNASQVNISFAYDGQYQGTLSNVTLNNIPIRFTYDERLRVIKEEQYLNGEWIEIDSTYDSMNRIVQLTGLSRDLDYYYNKQGRIDKINNYITSTGYNAFGSLQNKTYNNGLTSVFTYNPSNNRLTTITTGAIQNLGYSYDNVGNILSILDSIQSRNYSIGYDGLNRLINTTINNDLYQYEYNSIGNIKRIVRGNESKRLTYNGKIPHAPTEITEHTSGVGAYSAKDLDSDNKNRTIEFFLIKETINQQNNANWSINFGDNHRVNSTIPFNVSSPVLVLVQNAYSNGGSYNINVSTSFDANTFEDKFGIDAKSLELLLSNRTMAYSEFIIENDISENATNVEWNCTNGITSSQAFTIQGNDMTLVLIEYNYTSPGDKELTCKAVSDDGTGNKSTEFELKGLEIQNVTISELNTNQYRIEFNIINYDYPHTVTWIINSDGQSFTNSVALDTNQISTVTQDITYTTDGTKKVNISVYSGSIRDSEEYEFNIEALEIDRYLRESYNNDTERIISFHLTNQWPSNLSIKWNITEVNLQNSTYLSQNNTLMVVIAENFTSEGKKEPVITASSGTFLSTLSDWFNIHIIEALDLQTLKEGVTSTINEIIARSNSGNKTLSWHLDTGEEIINSTLALSINQSDQAIILIEHNYTSSGVYKTNASINSSTYYDDAEGVVIT